MKLVATDAGAQLVSRLASRSTLHSGDRVAIAINARNAHRFDAQGRAARLP